MIVCTRDVCENLDCLDAGSTGSLVTPSSEDFATNLLHLKCKVIQLARRQMLKDIQGSWRGPTINQGYLKSAGQGTNPLKTTPGPAENSVERRADGNDAKDLQVMDLGKKQREIVNHQESPNMETSPVPVAVPYGNVAPAPTEISSNFIFHWIKRILTSNFPFYWIIIAIGILGFTSLVCGVVLGAFICANGSHSFPFLFWAKSRVGHAVY